MRRSFLCFTIMILGVLALALAAGAGRAQEKNPAPGKGKAPAPAAQNRLTIEVTGGENNVPVENASVYVKFVIERKLIKDKKYELNVKTNRDGITHVPDAPLGKVLIQVIAEGWKTYGRWFTITDAQQTIQIHLEKPPRWY
ncbi:MAG: hypothetical protein LAN84_05755 [Acidobacteriia bacterium]|nr:hypothetical protein [Terriglobia bacterium]